MKVLFIHVSTFTLAQNGNTLATFDPSTLCLLVSFFIDIMGPRSSSPTNMDVSVSLFLSLLHPTSPNPPDFPFLPPVDPPTFHLQCVCCVLCSLWKQTQAIDPQVKAEAQADVSPDSPKPVSTKAVWVQGVKGAWEHRHLESGARIGGILLHWGLIAAFLPVCVYVVVCVWLHLVWQHDSQRVKKFKMLRFFYMCSTDRASGVLAFLYSAILSTKWGHCTL